MDGSNRGLISGKKYKPPASDRVDPAPSVASLADSSYQYPDPSPANSPSSTMLNSTTTPMSEAVFNNAVRDGGTESGASGETVGNGGAAAGGGARSKVKSVSVGVGGSVGEEPASRAVAGVQTTPNVNGAAEINRMK